MVNITKSGVKKKQIATEQPRSISEGGARLGRRYESCFLAVECDPGKPRSANGPISHESLPYPEKDCTNSTGNHREDKANTASHVRRLRRRGLAALGHCASHAATHMPARTVATALHITRYSD